MLLTHSKVMLGHWKCFEDWNLKELAIKELDPSRILFSEKENISKKISVNEFFSSNW